MIYLIRHGQTDWNVEGKIQGQTDIPLNKNGREQAQNVSKDITKLNITKIYSSDLSRARETAEIINKNIGAEIVYDKRLREVNFGIYEGKVKSDFTDENWDNPEKMKGESRKALYDRVKGFLSELNNDENTLVVTHGGALRMMFYYAENRDDFDMDSYKRFKPRWTNNAEIIEWK